MTGGASVVRANALAIPLADNTVDLFVTSPPYFALRSYKDGGEHYDGQIGAEPTPNDFVDALLAATREMIRCVKPTGSIFVNLGDKYAGSGGANQSGVDRSGNRRGGAARYNQNAGGVRAKSLIGIPWRYAIRCVDELGLILRAEIIWSKPNGMPEPHADRVRRSHEHWFHFVVAPRYFASMDGIRETYADDRQVTTGRTWSERKSNGEKSGNREASSFTLTGHVGTLGVAHPLGKLPSSVWTVATEPMTVPQSAIDEHRLPKHFAAFPTEWPRRIITGWCPPDGVVADPFGGTGTVAMVARALGRFGVSFDLSADYSRLARWRIFDSGHDHKVIARANGVKPKTPKKRTPKSSADSQGSLL